MRDLTERVGKFRIVCTVCDFRTEYGFEDLESAVKVAEAHKAQNPEDPDNTIYCHPKDNRYALPRPHEEQEIGMSAHSDYAEVGTSPGRVARGFKRVNLREIKRLT
jgi:hypothetical protein